ncbi:hypothetical protein LINPERHAP1_LOCUS18384 [Linum perenne]
MVEIFSTCSILGLCSTLSCRTIFKATMLSRTKRLGWRRMVEGNKGMKSGRKWRR